MASAAAPAEGGPSAPVLPVKGERNVLITSALPYVNNVPHLGNLIGCVLSADCYARYCRSRGYNTLYVCGTDEYGTATETKAREDGVTCQQICDKYHAIHAEIYKWFDISFDIFGRTPTDHQTRIVQEIFETIRENGFVEEQEMEQLYSTGLNKFLADRYVVGTCPKCGYEDARGDQCDKCTNMLNPTDLINPRCKATGTQPVLRTTRHMFLDLPQLSPQLQEWIDATSALGGWTSNGLKVTQAWMRDGLKQRCITRDLEWGVPVPVPGFENKVFYVWFDACIGYVSITACYTDEWKQWWQNPEDVQLVQFMGKDNVPFHTIVFPAVLLGTRQPWTKMRDISVTEYLNYEDDKFSKSNGIGVFGDNAKDTNIPVDVWRYYLLSNRPEVQDTDFRWSDLQAKNNGELLNNFGNFINRVMKFIADKFDGRIPDGSAEAGQEAVNRLGAALQPIVAAYLQAMEARKLRDGAFHALAASREGNAFFQDEKLWEVLKTDPDRCGALICACAGLVALLAGLIQPYMPSTSARIAAQLGVSEADVALRRTEALVATPHKIIPAGHQIGVPEPLFRTITTEEVESLRERFKGSQTERARKELAGLSVGKKGKGKGGKGGGKGADPDAPVDVSRLNLLVGTVTAVKQHEAADSLYVEDIDVGEETPRVVVSGLVKFKSVEQMLGARVVVVANMKPTALRGVRSHAMLLCASSPDGSKVEFVEPPAGAANGTRVAVEGFPGEPDEVLNPKKKVFEAVQPDLLTSEELVACYKGQPLRTPEGVCTVKSIAGGTIR